MSVFIKIIGDFKEKKGWRETKVRAKALPHDYRIAYEEIQNYLLKTSGIVTLAPFTSLLDLFEEGAANGRNVLEITGNDVAAFADELVRGEQSYFDKMRQDLNSDIAKKLNAQ